MQIQFSTTENCTSPLLVNGFSLEGVPNPNPNPIPTDPPDNTGGGGGNTGSLEPSDEQDEPTTES
jgi:hypothetical protein